MGPGLALGRRHLHSAAAGKRFPRWNRPFEIRPRVRTAPFATLRYHKRDYSVLESLSNSNKCEYDPILHVDQTHKLWTMLNVAWKECGPDGTAIDTSEQSKTKMTKVEVQPFKTVRNCQPCFSQPAGQPHRFPALGRRVVLGIRKRLEGLGTGFCRLCDWFLTMAGAMAFPLLCAVVFIAGCSNRVETPFPRAALEVYHPESGLRNSWPLHEVEGTTVKRVRCKVDGQNVSIAWTSKPIGPEEVRYYFKIVSDACTEHIGVVFRGEATKVGSFSDTEMRVVKEWKLTEALE